MECQNLFSGKNMNNVLSAEFAQSVVKVKKVPYLELRQTVWTYSLL